MRARTHMNKPTAFLGCAFAFTFLACTAASITPGAGTSSSTCDPDTCNPGFECIDNGKGTRAYCRKPCKGKAECAADEICYAPANVELVRIASWIATSTQAKSTLLTVVSSPSMRAMTRMGLPSLSTRAKTLTQRLHFARRLTTFLSPMPSATHAWPAIVAVKSPFVSAV